MTSSAPLSRIVVSSEQWLDANALIISNSNPLDLNQFFEEAGFYLTSNLLDVCQLKGSSIRLYAAYCGTCEGVGNVQQRHEENEYMMLHKSEEFRIHDRAGIENFYRVIVGQIRHMYDRKKISEASVMYSELIVFVHELSEEDNKTIL